MMNDRYARQKALRHIGIKGQEKLVSSRVAIVGMGALGSVQADLLCRAGVGFLRIIDRDTVEVNNLQRQVLYTEQDAAQGLPKVMAAGDHLRDINSGILIEEAAADLYSGNAETLLRDVDLVMDASDNMETRYLINEVCVKYGIPWIYGGAVESEGMTMNILPEGPCFCCMTGKNRQEGVGESRTCSTVGVLNSLTSIVASIQCTEALKILLGSANTRKSLLFLELWENETEEIPVEKNPACPVCGKREYWYLTHSAGMRAASFCGKDSIQIIPEGNRQIDLQTLRKKLEKIGTVRMTRFCLDFEGTEAGFQIYPDGRAIIRHVDTEGKAKSIYTEYIGAM